MLPIPLGLDCYVIVLPFDALKPYFNHQRTPRLLKDSSLFMRSDTWQEITKIAMTVTHCRDYAEILIKAREVLTDYGIFVEDAAQLHSVIDWFCDISHLVQELYNKLDGRPYRELAFHRLVIHEALYIRVYPL